MSVGILARYIGNKKLEVLHKPSGTTMITSAPLDNNGDGSSFSPTDLVAAALCSCTLTVISIVAEREGVDIKGAYAEVEKHMTDPSIGKGPRRIVSLPLIIHLPRALSPEVRLKYERVAKACPVHHSLHPEIEALITFLYDV